MAQAWRVLFVLGAAFAALASASSPPAQQGTQQPQQPYYPQQPMQPQAQYSPCENACGQIARCNLAPYDGCLAQCRQNQTEQQAGGPEQLNLLASSTCEQLSTAMQATQGQQPAQPQTTSTTTQASGAIATDYAVPAGYTSSTQNGYVMLTPVAQTDKTPCVYGLAPARASSGSLERDAAAALVEPLGPGWQRKDNRYDVMRGTSAAGWSYVWVRGDAMRPGQSYEYLQTMAMAFPASGNQVNILWGYGSPSRCMADDASFARIFHSLRPQGWKSDGGAALSRDIVGLWRNSQSVGTGQYRFKADGRYEFAINTTATVGFSERTSTSTHDGRWTLRDGVLTLTPEVRGRAAETRRIRIYDESRVSGTYRTLAMLDDRPDTTGEVVYYRVEDSR